MIVAVIAAALAGSLAGIGAASLTPTKVPTPAQYAPVAREVYLFTVVLPFDDSVAGRPVHDYFAPDTITVCKGDTLNVHFFNTEDEAEDHAFAMEAPYAMNHNLPFNSSMDFSFVASTAGSFAYRCPYHQPTMTGWLTVLDC